MAREKLAGQETPVRLYLLKKMSHRQIASKFGVSPMAVGRFIKNHELHPMLLDEFTDGKKEIAERLFALHWSANEIADSLDVEVAEVNTLKRNKKIENLVRKPHDN